MKKTVQIILLLCISMSLSAQKYTCEELMKLPLGKYLYENDGTSLALILNELENCGVEKYELGESILQIFISNIIGEKKEAATVQDLYDEILIFRKQNNSEEIKIRQEKEAQFHKEYGSKILSNEDWKNVKPLICDLFNLDDIELETFVNTLFEEKREELNINYGSLIEAYQKHIKAKFHLSKVAKRDSTDFDFGDSFYLFPSMDYFERRNKITGDKLILIYFYGYGVVNCEKLNDNVFYSPTLCKLVDSNFTFISLAVDSREKILETYKHKNTIEKLSGKTIRDVGGYNMAIQSAMIGTDTQPYFIVLDHFGHILLEIDYEKAKDTEGFIEALKSVL